MRRILVAFYKNGKKQYGWIIGFSGVDVLIELYNDTHFEIVPARLTEKVFSYFFYDGYDDDWYEKSIKEAIKCYEMKEKRKTKRIDKEDEEQEEQHHSGLISWH